MSVSIAACPGKTKAGAASFQITGDQLRGTKSSVPANCFETGGSKARAPGSRAVIPGSFRVGGTGKRWRAILASSRQPAVNALYLLANRDLRRSTNQP